MDHDELVNKRVQAIARAHSCSIDVNRDAYLKRTLALDLMRLDQLEMAFVDKALVDRDVASSVLLVKAAECRATLLGLKASLGHAVRFIQHRPDRIGA